MKKREVTKTFEDHIDADYLSNNLKMSNFKSTVMHLSTALFHSLDKLEITSDYYSDERFADDEKLVVYWVEVFIKRLDARLYDNR
jgi:hypothetical protein